MRNRAKIPRELAGKWVAWDREQTQIISSADTFDEVKQLAGDLGWREVVIGKVPSWPHWRSNGCHLLCVVAVFIAGMSNSLSDFVGW
jgi:hypothetical protein